MAPTRMILCDDSPSYFGSELKCNSILTMRGKEVKVILSSPCLIQGMLRKCTGRKLFAYTVVSFLTLENSPLAQFWCRWEKNHEG
jgi:hypothetical protein